MPFKLNQDRRHRIPRQKHRVINSAADDAALRQRGSLTVWFTDQAIEGWRAAPRTTPGGQPWYSPLATLSALTLRAVFRLALRQAEGLIGSIIDLLWPRSPAMVGMSKTASTPAWPSATPKRPSSCRHGQLRCGARQPKPRLHRGTATFRSSLGMDEPHGKGRPVTPHRWSAPLGVD